LNGGESDWVGLADEGGSADSAAADAPLLPDAAGELLASITVVPYGVCDAPGVTDAPGAGVTGTVVGRGVARGDGVGRGVGAVVGDGLGVGVGEVTRTGPAETGAGFWPFALTAVKVTVQLPDGRVVDPVQVPCPEFPLVSERGTDLLATEAFALVAVVVPLWNCTESWNNVAMVPDSGVTVGFWSCVAGGAPAAGVARMTSAAIAMTNHGAKLWRSLISSRSAARRRRVR
jgi:hypothetical protein